ncbi:MAG: hypothetical protein L0H83_10075 [Salinisphaera sp.]|nr:hypothetical protein [Salinisphaera sp.]
MTNQRTKVCSRLDAPAISPQSTLACVLSAQARWTVEELALCEALGMEPHATYWRQQLINLPACAEHYPDAAAADVLRSAIADGFEQPSP